MADFSTFIFYLDLFIGKLRSRKYRLRTDSRKRGEFSGKRVDRISRSIHNDADNIYPSFIVGNPEPTYYRVATIRKKSVNFAKFSFDFSMFQSYNGQIATSKWFR